MMKVFGLSDDFLMPPRQQGWSKALHGQSDVLLTPAALADRPPFTLGAATIDPAARTITGPGGTAVVEPRVMQVLVVLADAGGQVVTRDTLLRRCWGGVIVGEDSLYRVIAEIRRLARTVAADSFRIQTIPRTGYALDADPRPQSIMEPVADAAITDFAAVPPPATPTASAAPASPSRRILVLAGFAAAATAGLALWRARPAAKAEVAALLAEADQALRTGLPEADMQATRFLEAAIRLQPDSPALWGRLALARCQRAEYAPPESAGAAVTGTQTAARRALALDSRQPDALAALAILPPWFGDWLAAERRLMAVLADHPDHLPTRDALAFLHLSVGRARASALDRVTFAASEPLHATHQYRLIYALWILGRIGEADRAADRALQLWPRHPAVWFARLWTLAFTDRAPRAHAHIQDTAARPDLPPWMTQTLAAAMLALDSRRPADVSAVADRLVAEVSRGPSLSINALLILSALGELDRAFDVANAYLREEGPLMASIRWRPGQPSVNDQRRRKTQTLFIPATAPMRQDPRFLPLTQGIGLAAYWQKAGITPDFRTGKAQPAR